jgi:hypothetical protein
MSTRTSLLALAAAALAATALTSTGASANQPKGIIIKKPIMGVVINKPQPVMGLPINKPPVLGVIIKPKPPIPGIPVNPNPNPHPITGIVINPPDHDHDHDHDWDHDHDGDGPHFGWWRHHRSPWVIVDPAPVQVSAPVMAAPSTPAPCTCLTKGYLQDGSVMFKDMCTKEAAIATPDELRAQAQGN